MINPIEVDPPTEYEIKRFEYWYIDTSVIPIYPGHGIKYWHKWIAIPKSKLPEAKFYKV